MSFLLDAIRRWVPNLDLLQRFNHQMRQGYVSSGDLADRLVWRARRAPRDVPEGLVIGDATTAWSWLKFALAWGAAGGWNVVTWRFVPRASWSFTHDLQNVDSGGRALVLIVLALMVLIALASAFAVIRWTLNAWNMRPARLVVARWPLRLGELVWVRYERPFRRTLRRRGTLCARLVCLEHTAYDAGSQVCQSHEFVWNEDFKDHEVERGSHGALAQWLVRIPTEGPATFLGRRNRVIWGLDVLLRTPGGVRASSTFVLSVVPEVVG
jgi:hypothetical protein